MTKGYIYVLINPAMPGLSKVGKTTRLPTERLLELSAPSGVPSPFILAYQQPVADCHTAEIWVHRELERGGYRLTERREFFQAPLHVIVQVVSQAADLASPVNDDEPVLSIQSPGAAKVSSELYELGMQYIEGTDSVLRDCGKGLKIVEQSAEMGHTWACSQIGSIYSYGLHGARKDSSKALGFFKKSVANGAWHDLASMAGIFLEAGQKSAAIKHWKLFFEAAYNERGDDRDLNVEYYSLRYCKDVAEGKMDHCIADSVIAELSPLLLSGIEKEILVVNETPDRGLAIFRENKLIAARLFVLKTIDSMKI